MMRSETANPFLDLIPDAALIVDRDWRIVAQNHAAVEASPALGEAVLLWDAWPALCADAPAALLRQAMATGQRANLEKFPHYPAGSDRWLALQATPHEPGLAVVLRDITRETRREKRSRLLQELTEQLSAALEPEDVGAVIIGRAMPALGANAGNVYLVDDDGTALVSVAALGYAPAVLDEARVLPLDGPTLMAEVTRTREPILLSRWEDRVKRYPHHHYIHGIDGDRAVAGVPLKVQGRTIGALSLAFPTDRTFDPDERQFIATVADLCAQTLARSRLYTALRRSEAQARLVTDRAPAFLAHINADGRYEYVNDEFASRLGLTPEQVIGRSVPEVIGSDAYTVVRRNLEAALAGQEIEYEAEVPYAGIGTRFVKISYAPNRDDRGRVHGVVAVIIDLTERQRAEQARQILADTGAILGSTLEPRAILGEFARIAVRGFASHCAVWLSEDGVLRQVGAASAVDASETIPWPALPAADGWRRPIISRQPVAAIAVPLRSQENLLGAVQFILRDAVSLDDVWLADELGQRSATLLENSSLYRSLRESEGRFRQLADAIPEIAWVISGDGARLEYINRRWLDYAGLAIAADATPLANAHIHAMDQAVVADRWAAARRDGASFTMEIRLRSASGVYRWFLSRVEPVHDALGRVVKWFGAATDIDDMKRAESSQRFLAQLSGVLAVSLDPAAILRRVARLVVPALADYCLVDFRQPDGAIRRVAWAHIDPVEQQHFDDVMERLFPAELDPSHPICQIIESGEPLLVADVDDTWLEQIAFSAEHLEFVQGRRLRSRLSVPLRARDRTLGALTLCFSDTSGRRYRQEDLDFARDVAERIAFAVDNARLYTESQAAAAKVRRLLDAGVVGIVVADAERILEANDYFLEMIGYSREALEHGRLRWPVMTPPEFSSLDARALAELAEDGLWTPYEKEYIHRDGSRIPIMIGGAILERDPLQWICFILDLTDLKRGEAEWRAFIDATAHDLRNPLTSVLGQAQLLQRRLQRDGALDPADAEQRLTAVATASRRAAGLIDDLIDTARLRAGLSLEMRPAPLDLVRIVRTCADDARRVGRSHVIHVAAAVDRLLVVADEPRIERVIRNMLDNAIKFSPDGGDIIVSIGTEEAPTGSWAVLTIEDRGLGIPVDDLDHVFDQFRRGTNVEGRIHGSGIGLSGARQIVSQHGGEIQVRSTEGEGSMFTLRLPILPDAPSPPYPANALTP